MSYKKDTYIQLTLDIYEIYTMLLFYVSVIMSWLTSNELRVEDVSVLSWYFFHSISFLSEFFFVPKIHLSVNIGCDQLQCTQENIKKLTFSPKLI